MCEFCNNEDKMPSWMEFNVDDRRFRAETVYTAVDHKIYTGLSEKDGDEWNPSAIPGDVQFLKFNYCPVCGRKYGDKNAD